MKRQKFKGARGKGYLKGEGVMGNVVWMATNDAYTTCIKCDCDIDIYGLCNCCEGCECIKSKGKCEG